MSVMRALRLEEPPRYWPAPWRPAVLAAAEPGGRRLIGRGREGVFGQRRRHVSRPSRRRPWRSPSPGRSRACTWPTFGADSRRRPCSIAAQQGGHETSLFFFRPGAIDDDRVEGRRALLGDVGRREDRLAPEALILGQHRIPDEGAVDVRRAPRRARISGGRRLMTCRSPGLMPALSRA